MELNSSTLADLKIFFRYRLQQFGLLGSHEPDDVINESIVRLDRAIKAGKQILNLEAWIRVTGLNYIRELSRKQKKCQAFDPFELDKHTESEQCDFILEEADTSEHRKVREALQELKPQEREILELRFFEKLSWQDIAQYLANKGNCATVDALRKKGERAIKRLRKVFLSKYF
ncbi:sigma-70 family RNA polymerase sigma factor [Aerosakkonema sp. BLCC-F183]|uniref:sigma-70 family RNA polymerase sigma factor n=1 Tax=Aerosakkonema sp. BLCC-F183 TaxID=3342834 RepID=UPI0035B7EF15